MEIVITTKITYKYLMNKSKHELAQMVLDLLDKQESRIVSPEPKEEYTCSDCGAKNIRPFSNGDGKTCCEDCAVKFYYSHHIISCAQVLYDTNKYNSASS